MRLFLQHSYHYMEKVPNSIPALDQSLTRHLLVITLCRAFTNHQDAEGYKYLFEKVFGLVERYSNQPVGFHYLHGHGFESITLDMDEGQMLGMIF